MIKNLQGLKEILSVYSPIGSLYHTGRKNSLISRQMVNESNCYRVFQLSIDDTKSMFIFRRRTGKT